VGQARAGVLASEVAQAVGVERARGDDTKLSEHELGGR
jgi:hypothetical protein